MLLYWQCQAEPIFISSDGKAARAAGLFPGIWQIGGVWCYVHHTPIGSAQSPHNQHRRIQNPFRYIVTYHNAEQRRARKGGARGGKAGFVTPSAFPPRKPAHCPSVPLKGKRPLPKCPPERETPTAQVSPKKKNALRAGAYVRRPTVYNIWYNFLINFVNSTFPCIL